MNVLKVELSPICHLVALLGAHHILHVSRIRVKLDSIMCFICVGHHRVFGQSQGEGQDCPKPLGGCEFKKWPFLLPQLVGAVKIFCMLGSGILYSCGHLLQ